jgi:hypothetical protein
MNRALVKRTTKPPKELASFFADPPLVGDESREDYDNLFSALAAAVKPVDAIAWIYLGDFTNLTWEITRERWLKQRAVEAVRKDVVRGLLMPPPPPPPFTGGLMLFPALDPTLREQPKSREHPKTRNNGLVTPKRAEGSIRSWRKGDMIRNIF